MILSPAIIAIAVSSAATSGMLLYAAAVGARVLRGWNSESGSEAQLLLERKTLLVSSILSYLLGFQFISLMLFIRTADALHPLFTGAMCAAGTLNLNSSGYPALILKIVNTLGSGIWLIINHADSRGHDFPLVRAKYSLLLLLAPLVFLEMLFVTGFISGLKPDVITSCCGSLFGGDQGTFARGLSSLPALLTVIVYSVVSALVVSAAGFVLKTGRGGIVLGLSSLTALPVSIAALVSVFCLYYYEIPTHHCPFCLLQKEYSGIGYLLYILLLIGGTCGISCAVLQPARVIPSLHGYIPRLQKMLALPALVSFGLFALIMAWRAAFSPFKMSW